MLFHVFCFVGVGGLVVVIVVDFVMDVGGSVFWLVDYYFFL